MTHRRRVAVLGSTGSIGTQTLEVIRRFPERFEVVGLAAGRYGSLFRSQLEEFRPRMAAAGRALEQQPDSPPHGILRGAEGLAAIASDPEVDLVVVATVGRAGLVPALAAASSGKMIALANKESLVMAGKLVTTTVRECGAQLLPMDSEHSAIWQCLRGEGEMQDWASTVKALILTASGGALRDLPAGDLERVPPSRVLAHPTWKMGPKITVDSATLMNKGLEVIEAQWLFGLPLDRVRVLLHRESIVHSMVEFVDGSVKAQLGPADMRIPIQYALTFPERMAGATEPLDLARVGCLSFGEIDMLRYPCLGLALESARKGLSYPAALCGSNEAAVELFLAGRIPFGTIPVLVGEVLSRHEPIEVDSLEAALGVDDWARNECMALAENGRGN